MDLTVDEVHSTTTYRVRSGAATAKARVPAMTRPMPPHVWNIHGGRAPRRDGRALPARPGEHGDLLRERILDTDAALVADLITAAAGPARIEAGQAAAAVEPYSWLLDRVGAAGITLTAAGYLPPAVVGEAMTVLSGTAATRRTAQRERQCVPVLELRQSARRLGLVRTHRGILLRTTAGEDLQADPVGLWRHIAGRLPDAHDEMQSDAGYLLLVAVAAGTTMETDAVMELLHRGMAVLGWRESGTGRPLTKWEAFRAARDTWTCLRRLGAIPEAGPGQSAGPPAAGVALARTALINQPARLTPAGR